MLEEKGAEAGEEEARRRRARSVLRAKERRRPCASGPLGLSSRFSPTARLRHPSAAEEACKLQARPTQRVDRSSERRATSVPSLKERPSLRRPALHRSDLSVSSQRDQSFRVHQELSNNPLPSNKRTPFPPTHAPPPSATSAATRNGPHVASGKTPPTARSRLSITSTIGGSASSKSARGRGEGAEEDASSWMQPSGLTCDSTTWTEDCHAYDEIISDCRSERVEQSKRR